MKTVAPPRIALALLRWRLPHDESLVGDLLEEFAQRQSRLWLWRQAAAAVVQSFHRDTAIRPLRLVDEPTSPPAIRPTAKMPTRVNMNGGLIVAASPIRGVGGLLVAAFFCALIVLRPTTWWVAALSTVAVVAVGGLRIAVGHRRSAVEARRRSHVLMGR